MTPRALGLLLVVVLLAGCGGSSGTKTSTSSSGSSSGKKPYVVLVTDIGQLNDHGFNQLAYSGLRKAVADLGVKGDVYQSPSSSDYIPNLTQAARKGADLVVSVGFDQANSIARVAKQFPNTHFAIIDVDWNDLPGKPANVEGLIFKEQEVGYLAGYLAGLVEKANSASDKNVIGSVGGQKQPGSFGYEYLDAMTYAAWGVDYLKNDSCNQAIGSVARDDRVLRSSRAERRDAASTAGGTGLTGRLAWTTGPAETLVMSLSGSCERP